MCVKVGLGAAEGGGGGRGLRCECWAVAGLHKFYSRKSPLLCGIDLIDAVYGWVK